MKPRASWPLATALVLALAASPARAQSAGDAVRIETSAGVIEGTLVDRLPDGYLVRSGEASHVVPYTSVRSIVKLAPAVPLAPPAAPPAQPYPPPTMPVAPQPPYAQPPAPPTVIVVSPPSTPAPDSPPPNAVELANPPRRRGLTDAGSVLITFGALGLAVGAVLAPVGAVMRATQRCHDPSGDLEFQCEYGHGTTVLYAGGVGLAAGGALLLTGLVLRVAGRATTAAAHTSIPAVSVGPTGGSLRWSF